jgi:two-component system chemotaxis response regulator CheY
MALNVLIADDSKWSRKRLKASFPEGWDVSITEVGDGAAALESCNTAMPDILFLDLNMPEVDGYGVLRGLQGCDHKPLIFVVTADGQ